MQLKEWLDAERGRNKRLAAYLGVSPGRVSQMADEGVPDRNKLAVRDFTDGSVTLEDMVLTRTQGANPTPDEARA